MTAYRRAYGFGHLSLPRTEISSRTLCLFRVWDYLTLISLFPVQTFLCPPLLSRFLPLQLNFLLSIPLINPLSSILHHSPLHFSPLHYPYLSFSCPLLPFPGYPALIGSIRALPSAFIVFVHKEFSQHT